jgi:hypothetical protein
MGGKKPLRIYVGWDKRDALAYEVARQSAIERASGPVEIIPLKDWVLRGAGVYWRSYFVNPRGQMFDERDYAPFSTDFTYTRFLVPALEAFADCRVLFTDPDILWRADPYALLDLAPAGAAVACVKHRHDPSESTKMTGNIQTHYPRKNWSSVMVFNPSRCRSLSVHAVNTQSRDWLHGFAWARDEDIAELPLAWNWLEGYSETVADPALVHFTKGTPDMPGHEEARYAAEWWEVARRVQLAGG